MPNIRIYVCYCRLWCAVLGCWLLGVRCRAAGCASRKRDVAYFIIEENKIIQLLFNIYFLYLGTAILVCTYKFLPVVYGCETWSLTLREERRPRVLKRIFGPKRDEVMGEWRKLHSE